MRYSFLDLAAHKITKLTGLNRNTVNHYMQLIRKQIAAFFEQAFPVLAEIDESSFGAKRVKGKRGRGAYGKTPVFGIFQRGGSVYTEIVPDCAWKTLLTIIRARIDPDSVIHSDSWRGDTGQFDLGYKQHFRVHRGKNELANGRRHISGIESLWSYAERWLTPFHGVPRSTFYLHIKECEFRVNHRSENIYRGLLKLLK